MAREIDFGISLNLSPEMRLQDLRCWARRFQVRSDIGGCHRRTKVDVVEDIHRAARSPWVELYQDRMNNEAHIRYAEHAEVAEIHRQFHAGATAALVVTAAQSAARTGARDLAAGSETVVRSDILTAEVREAASLSARFAATIKEAALREVVARDEEVERCTLIAVFASEIPAVALCVEESVERRELMADMQEERFALRGQYVSEGEQTGRAAVERLVDIDLEGLCNNYLPKHVTCVARIQAQRCNSTADSFEATPVRCVSDVRNGKLEFDVLWKAIEKVEVATVGLQKKNNAADLEIARLNRQSPCSFLGVTEVCRKVYQRLLLTLSGGCQDTVHIPGHCKNLAVRPTLGPWIPVDKHDLDYAVHGKPYHIAVCIYAHSMTRQRLVHGTAHVAWANKKITADHFLQPCAAMKTFAAGEKWALSIDGNCAAAAGRYDPRYFHDLVHLGEPYLGTASDLPVVLRKVDETSAFLRQKGNTDHPNIARTTYGFELCGVFRMRA
jgi:hypothetical protein